MLKRQMKQYIYLDGKFIFKEKAKVSCLDPGFLYGCGLFETMRSYNGKIFAIDAHLDRLFKSNKLIGLKLANRNELKREIGKLLKLNSIKHAYVRLTAWKGDIKSHILVFTRKFPPYLHKETLYKRGVNAVITKVRQNEFSPLSRIKSLNYLNLRLAYKEAQKRGASEGLLLNTKGFLCEGSRTNIFLVKDNKLFTSSCDCGCLAGITRNIVLKLAKYIGLKTYEKHINPGLIYKVDEVFLTNSLMEIMPLVKIGKRKIRNGKPGIVTLNLLDKYRELTQK